MTTTTRQTYRNNKKQPQPVDLNVCALCLGTEHDVEQYGKFFRCSTQELAVHEYCMFFASGLAQNGEDHEGFDGFIYEDIKNEIKRASKLRCTICHKKGAAIGCCVSKCGSAFHFTCGLQKHALFQFFDSFRVFCKRHRPVQTILPLYSGPTQTPTCPICLCEVDRSDRFTTLKSTCCKNAWFHRSCIQKQALANGMYFFRCAFCNNFDEFQEEMKQMGIYIPDRDAIWEQGDAYVELLHQHNRCDAGNCVCPKGREFSGKLKGQRWKIYKCFACGQSGTHRRCQEPEMSRKFFCQNCVVCFPQHGQTKNNTSTASEGGTLDDSQSSTSLSQNSDTTSELNASADLDNTPLSHLIDHFKTKMRAMNSKDDCYSNTGSETTTLTIEDGFSITSKDAVCSLDDYTTIVSSDGSNDVDVENLSTDSSCSLTIDSDLNIDGPRVKPMEKKRKAFTNENKAVRCKTSNLKTKAQRRAKREEYNKKRAQQGRQPKIKKKSEGNQTEMSSKSDSNETANDSFGLLVSQESDIQEKTKGNHSGRSTKSVTKNGGLNKNANDPFSLLLSPEVDTHENGLKATSPSQDEILLLPSSDEDCHDKHTFDGLSTSFNESVSITSSEENSDTDGKIAKHETGLASELRTEAASLSSPAKSSESSERSTSSGKKKLCQRDIRSMLLSPNNDSLERSPEKVVEDQGCQTEPLKIRRGNKRRKLSDTLSEYKSITTFMSVKSPKRKGKLKKTSLDSLLPNDKTETVSSTVSNSIMETMTAAKGMVMRALKRLSGSSEVSEEIDASPRKSLSRGIDSSNTESKKSGLSEDSDHDGDARSRTKQNSLECIEGTDSDSSDSIKVVKVKQGRGQVRSSKQTDPNIPLSNIKKHVVPSYIHEKFCACYKMQEQKRLMLSRQTKPHDPNEVIVIDDENDNQDDEDSGKGSSRDTSDAGTKSGDGSGAEDKESPLKDDQSLDYYSSCEDEVSYEDDDDDDDDDRMSNQKASLKLDSLTTNDIGNCQSVTRDADRPKRRIKGNSRKSSKKSKTDVKKRAEKHPCPPSISGQQDASPAELSRELLENSSLTQSFNENVDKSDTFESLDCLMDENNFKQNFKKKGKSHSSKAGAPKSNSPSPLTQKSKTNLSSKKSLEVGPKKKFLSLKRYMECSDEDFQPKKTLISRSKGTQCTMPKDKDQTKKRKKKKAGTKGLGNSSCTFTVPTVNNAL